VSNLHRELGKELKAFLGGIGFEDWTIDEWVFLA
jgi:hypothetical protein